MRHMNRRHDAGAAPAWQVLLILASDHITTTNTNTHQHTQYLPRKPHTTHERCTYGNDRQKNKCFHFVIDARDARVVDATFAP